MADRLHMVVPGPLPRSRCCHVHSNNERLTVETVRTYMAVIREPGNPEVDGTKMEWFFHMPGELEEFLTTVGWKRGPRTDGGAAGVWSHHSAAPARWLEVEAL